MSCELRASSATFDLVGDLDSVRRNFNKEEQPDHPSRIAYQLMSDAVYDRIQCIDRPGCDPETAKVAESMLDMLFDYLPKVVDPENRAAEDTENLARMFRRSIGMAQARLTLEGVRVAVENVRRTTSVEMNKFDEMMEREMDKYFGPRPESSQPAASNMLCAVSDEDRERIWQWEEDRQARMSDFISELNPSQRFWLAGPVGEQWKQEHALLRAQVNDTGLADSLKTCADVFGEDADPCLRYLMDLLIDAGPSTCFHLTDACNRYEMTQFLPEVSAIANSYQELMPARMDYGDEYGE